MTPTSHLRSKLTIVDWWTDKPRWNCYRGAHTPWGRWDWALCCCNSSKLNTTVSPHIFQVMNNLIRHLASNRHKCNFLCSNVSHQIKREKWKQFYFQNCPKCTLSLWLLWISVCFCVLSHPFLFKSLVRFSRDTFRDTWHTTNYKDSQPAPTNRQIKIVFAWYLMIGLTIFLLPVPVLILFIYDQNV